MRMTMSRCTRARSSAGTPSSPVSCATASSMQNENATAGVGSEPLSRRPHNSMKIDSPVKLALAICLLSLVSFPAGAEVTALRIARQYGVGYLQMMVMENNRLIEKHAKAGGLGDVTLSWSTFADGTVASDAILSGNLDYAAGGLGSFMTLWDRTRGNLQARSASGGDTSAVNVPRTPACV